LGGIAYQLVGTGCGWVRRRKESVVFVDETLVRRHMTVDFELPPHVEAAQETNGDAVYYAPLFFLQKGSDRPFVATDPLGPPEPHFASFDYRNESGTALSLPARRWNALVTEAMLWVAARAAAEHDPALNVDDDLALGVRGLLRSICEADRRDAGSVLSLLRSTPQAERESRFVQTLDGNNATFRELLTAAAVSSVVMVPLIGEGRRRGIHKLAYDEQIVFFLPALRALGARLGWTGYEVWLDTPFIAASSYHFEAAAPAGLEIYDSGLVEVAGDSAQRAHTGPPTLARVSGFASGVHLYASDASDRRKAFAWVRLRVRRHDFVGGAVAAALMVTVSLWLGYAVRHEAARAVSNAPSLLLLFPGALAAYVARPGRHRLTARMLLVARQLLALASVLPFLAAASLTLSRTSVTSGSSTQTASTAFFSWWLWLAVASSVVFAALLITRLLPQPQISLAGRFWTWLRDLYTWSCVGPAQCEGPSPLTRARAAVVRCYRAACGRRDETAAP
jgi:hypothetical protein